MFASVRYRNDVIYLNIFTASAECALMIMLF